MLNLNIDSVADIAEKTIKAWYVYIVVTASGTLYAGITTDLERRFNEHCDVFNGIANGKGAKYFRAHQPLSICFKKAFDDRSSASKYESMLKQLSRKQKLELIAQAEVRVTQPM